MQKLLVVPKTQSLAILGGLLALGALAFMAYFLSLDNRHPAYSVIQYEFARTPQFATQMFRAWKPDGLAVVRWSLYVDFAFMPVYAFAFAAVTLLAARAAWGGVQAWGLWLGLAPFAAWAFDILENIGLLVALSRPDDPSGLALAVSAAAATIKFSLLGLTVLYWFGVIIERLAARRTA